MDLKTPVGYIKGVGESRAKAFGRLGVFTAGDLLCFYPKRYEFRGDIKRIAQTRDGETCSAVIKIDSPPREGRGKSGIHYVKSSGTDGDDVLYLTFFNSRWIVPALSPGRLLRVYGRVAVTLYGHEMINPAVEPYSPDLKAVSPVYPATKSLTQKAMAKAVESVLALADEVPETFPEEVRKQFSLITKTLAIKQVHFPQNQKEADEAVRRLAFEELAVFQLALYKLKAGQSKKVAKTLSLKGAKSKLFFDSLPFELTNAQKNAVKEIFADLQKETPMTRLLQGDVGSGKTVLAAASAYLAAKNGFQTAFMAPTEILAAQHFATLSGMLSPHGIKAGILTGSLGAASKKKIKDDISNGEVDVIIGTNAVIQSDVEFSNLGLAITDEQHRFGVIQRASLITKGEGETSPHTLVMSATPIPRTLSLILYGDLDVSVLDELPPGRQNIKTYAIDGSDRKQINDLLESQLRRGRQVFVVCPLAEESEVVDALSATEKYEAVIRDFPSYPASLLHGRMKGKDKNAIMAAFKSGETKILVSTTVVEVGVDVPNATVMVVENSERFGLSTLHQLRGRIGRGREESFCLLVYDKESKKSRERLEIMCRTQNGFEIAETDLKLRGPGEFFGEKQSGEISFKIANIADMALIKQTRALVDMIIDKGLLDENGYAELNSAAEELFVKSFKRNILN